MNDYQIRFLKQYIMGQRIKLNDSDSVIRRCIELADRDMLSGGRFICEEFKVKSHAERVNYVYDLLESKDYNYLEIDKKKVCEDLFWKLDNTIMKEVKGTRRSYKSFGLAQKLINMTYKYLYVYKDHTGKKIDFSNCECPVDSIVIGELNRDEKWTNITCDEYVKIQESINKAMGNEKYLVLKEEIGGLAFDDNWVNDK